MSADDPKPEDETPETPETLQDEQAEGGPPQEELDAEAPTTDAEQAPESLDPEPEDEAPKAAAKPKKKPAAEKAKADDAEDAEEKPKPKRSRAKKADEPKAEEAKAEKAEKPKPAKAAPSANGNGQVVRAQAKYVRTSARKARLVCDHLRGKSVEEARAILLHTPRHVARDWSKLLESAVANAEHNHELVGDELRIISITADEGPTIKRFRPRAMGRASRIRKRTAHLSISLTSKES